MNWLTIVAQKSNTEHLSRLKVDISKSDALFSGTRAQQACLSSRVVIRGFVVRIDSTNPRIFFPDVEFEDSRIHHRSQQTTNIRDSSTNHEYDSITRKDESLSIIGDLSNNAE